MSSPLVAAWSSIATIWEALTPPDRISITYHQSGVRGEDSGGSGDRSFVPLAPSVVEPVGQGGAALTQAWWESPIQLRLTQAGRTRLDLSTAIANETVLLWRAVEKAAGSGWPSGVYAIVLDGSDIAIEEISGDALITFKFRVLTAETD